MITRSTLMERLNEGEDERTEFKRIADSVEDISRIIVAFANRPEGGWLIIGVNEDGTVGGIDNPKEVANQITKICNDYCIPKVDPNIDPVSTSKGPVIIVHIEERHPPYRTKNDRFWIRKGDKTEEISIDELNEKLLGKRREKVSHQLLRVRVNYFKSLYDIDLPLKPLNILIGPNGSGKSNLFKLLEFIKRRTLTPPTQQDNSNLNELIWAGDMEQGEPPDSFQAELLSMLPVGVYKDPLVYNTQVVIEDPQNLRFVSEKLSQFVGKDRGDKTDYIDRTREKVSIVSFSQADDKPIEQRQRRYPISKNHLALQSLSPLTDSEIIRSFHQYVCGWWISNLNVNKARMSTKHQDPEAKTMVSLNEDGSNLSEFLNKMKRLQPDDWREFNWRLKSVDFIESIESKSETYSGSLGEAEYRVREKAFDKSFSTNSISRGTIHFIFYTALLLGDHNAQLVCMEEPDNGIHPALMKELSSVIRDVVKNKEGEKSPQVLLTTHDPALLNMFERDLGEEYFQVIVVEKNPTTGISRFNVLERKELGHWLEDFRIGELQTKGILDDYGRGDRG